MALASLYATKHRTMHTNVKCGWRDYNFQGGITNGAEWYVFKGGMQDFNYHFSNCMEITLELNCCKHVWPTVRQLQQEWENNEQALLSYVEAAQTGLRGIVMDSNGQPVEGARVEVQGIDKHVMTTERGEYWRLLYDRSYNNPLRIYR